MTHGDTLTAAPNACRAARPPESRPRHRAAVGVRRAGGIPPVYSRTGGAQYGQATTEANDLLTVYAEAFERDANPKDFSLDAMMAHERGHQLLVRHPRIAKLVRGRISAASEEILASLLGALICADAANRDSLVLKATAELLDHGATDEIASRQIRELQSQLEALL